MFAKWVSVFFSSKVWRWIKKVPLHWLFPIVVGGIVSFFVHRAVLMQSIVVFSCAYWLCIDIGVWIYERTWPLAWKSIAVSSSFCALMCIRMLLMHSFYSSMLEDQRSDAFKNLTIEHYDFGSANNPLRTMFTIRNNSGQDISRKHAMICAMRTLVAPPRIVKDVTTFLVPGGWNMVFGNEDPIESHIASDKTIEPGGDGESMACLSDFTDSTSQPNGLGPNGCLDLEITFWYALANQEEIEQEKRFHFLAYRGKDQKVSWYPEPADSTTDYCSQILEHTFR